jgi:hypothetical protein
MTAIPAISAPEAMSPSTSTPLVFEFDVVVDVVDSFGVVVVVVLVVLVDLGVLVDASLPPVASSLNALPPPAPAATAIGAHALAGMSAASAHRHPSWGKDRRGARTVTQSRISPEALVRARLSSALREPSSQRGRHAAHARAHRFSPTAAQTVE